MSQWEHLILIKLNKNFTFNFTEQDFLNDQGKQGWKLVCVIRGEISRATLDPSDYISTYYFNRPKAVPKKEPISVDDKK